MNHMRVGVSQLGNPMWKIILALDEVRVYLALSM